ncbi:metal-dependent hydrolase [Methanoculleus sp. FWC-SCC1]|uniref:Metal-dependent hydrolase n=1 Tax=Methanoculleus frigidifontis TaxID=2584085 RepID=A0ABT8MA30_9EURY|nr:metal-dependent hydrolase [Methanoculleus sp. FWC-SCC1]MDN7024793.1 metal-dependent hydrolase [Methanoculleus sp. FWC-SCC1]
MFVLAHLVAGLLIGLTFWKISGDRRAVIVGAVGGVLSDVIDKPLGHIFLKGSVDYGRIYFHGLAVLLVLLILGLVLWRYRGVVLGIVLAAAVFSHQIMDGMWRHPIEWYWPLLGAYPKHLYTDYFWNAFWREISQPSEWVFFVAAAGILGYFYHRELRELLARCPVRPLRRLIRGIAARFTAPHSGR